MKEKQVLEKKNMAVIERVYRRLKDDSEVQGASVGASGGTLTGITKSLFFRILK